MFLLLACAPDAGLTTYNSPPSATILTPTAGEAFWEYEPVTFSAKVSDNATAPSDLILVWSAGAAGALSGEQTIADERVSLHVADGFAAGDWGVSLQVTDQDGESVVAEVQFLVTENLAPNVNFLSPAEGAVYGSDVSVPVTAFVTDADAASNEELALTWSVQSGPAYPNTSGYAEFTLTDLAIGSHELTVTVTDAAGDSDSALVHFSVSDSDVDGDGYSSDDCNDSDATVHPAADETCDTVDNDCDGEIDEAGGTSWYADTDADGYGGGSSVVSCSQPSGYAAVSGDCDDASASVNPAATETCNEIDDDCDGSTDEDGGTDWYLDADGDGYGSSVVSACDAPAGYVALDGDCDDADAEFHPGAAELCDDPTDYNCDGSTGYADADGDGLPACEDCDDSRALSDEECNGLDDDCDGDVDESSAIDAATWYVDRDADGYGSVSAFTLSCDLPSGYADDPDDCDDADDTIYPGAAETCDLEDEDCDGTVDNDAIDVETWYLDGDGDGYGTTSTVEACDEPAGYAWLDGDCDDADAAYNPGATEPCDDPADYNCDGSTGYTDADGDGLAACEDCDDTRALTDETCNDLDDDCDGEVDEAGGSDWYLDADGDGYGSSVLAACDVPTGYVVLDGDCDDSDSGVRPDAEEICNDEDDDCDGDIDESGGSDWYLDGDGDGYGDGTATVACDQPGGYVKLDGDCDDADAAYNPGESELDCADPNDYNCDGSTGYADADRDGLPACEDCDDTRELDDESCNGLDDDCDGDVDEEGGSEWYLDADTDDYGGDSAVVACDQPDGYVDNSDDCDDLDADSNPAAPEYCDGEDDDCDGDVDEASAVDAESWYADGDADGYGDGAPTVACDAPAGSVAVEGDCDDADAAYNPGASETCDDPTDYNCDGSTSYEDVDGDGLAACEDCDDERALADESCNDLDDDCDGTVDEDVGDEWYADADGDGHGAGAATVACDQPTGYADSDDDCDDGDSGVSPDAVETCDDVDEDCDGSVDDGAIDMSDWYADGDGDGYGDGAAKAACDQPSGYVVGDGDCDEADAALNPGETEVCDDADTDEDCDGKADDLDASVDPSGKVTAYIDNDGDDYGSTDYTKTVCDIPSSYESSAGDCDDTDASVNVESTWYIDADGDGYGGGATTTACEEPSGYTDVGDDCDDGDADVNPGADEHDGDSVDEDCDGCAPAFADDFEGETEGAPVSADDGWSCCGTDCVSVYSADPVYAGSRALSLAGGSGEVGHSVSALADDFVLSLRFYDGGGTSGYDNLELFLGSACGSIDLAAGLTETSCGASYCAWSATDGYELLGARSTGWHTMVVRVDYASGLATIDVDGESASVTVGDTYGYFWFQDDRTADSIDGVIIQGADSGDCDAGADLDWYADGDGDGYGDAAVSVSSETWPSGYVANADDCDDGDGSVGVASFWYADADGDGYGDGASKEACDQPSGYVATDDDCDDGDAAANPGEAEVCDEVDNDCDGSTDEGVTSSFYADTDGDGYGAGSATAACSAPSGHVSSADDCDDGDSGVHPGADEYCNDADDDCDDETDEDALDEATWYLDADGDGYGVATTTTACDLPSGYADNDEDCDDTDSAVNPGATEAGGDEDCDGCIADFSDDFDDETEGAAVAGDDGWSCFGSSCSSVYSGGTLSLAAGSGEVGQTVSAMADDFVFTMDFYDSGDTSGNFLTLFGTSGGSSEFTVGYSSSCGYCIDGSTTIVSRSTGWHTMSVRVSYSSHTAEVAIDATSATVDFSATLGAFWFNDDGTAESVDDIMVFGADSGECSAGVTYTWYYDGDGDGYGDSSTSSASWPSGYVIEDGDCDDGDSSVSPGVEEVCDNGVDDDCDGGAGTACRWTGDEQVASVAAGVWYGEARDDHAGKTVSFIPDASGDGLPDLLLAAPESDHGGSDDGAVYIWVSADLAGGSLADASGVIASAGQSTSLARAAIGLDDVSGDGLGDVLVVGADSTGSSAVLLYAAPAGGAYDRDDAMLTLAMESGVSPSALGSVDDLDGDGLPELLVGSWSADVPYTDAGRAYLVNSSGLTDSNLSAADTIIYGDAPASDVGVGVEGVGDLDGDGVPEFLIVTASGGLSYSGLSSGSLTPGDADAEFSTSSSMGAATGGHDVDGDGLADVLFGAPYGDGYVGGAYLFTAVGTGTLTTADATAAFAGEVANDFAGCAVALGDLDGDASSDLVIGRGTINNAGSVGGAYLVHGPASGTMSLADADASFESAEADDYTGRSVAMADVDGDGSADILIGAPYADDGGGTQPYSGAAYLILGGGM